MKCFYVYPNQDKRYEGYVFADTRGKAKKYALEALHNAAWTQIKFTDINATREKKLDKYFIHGEEGTIFDYNQVLTGGR